MKTFQLTRASDAGRILNPLAGRNQIEGAVVMGIGMALLEHTSYDPQSGAPINSNLADYMVAVNADVPPIEVHFLDFPDKRSTNLAPAASARSDSPASPPPLRLRSTMRQVYGCVNFR